MKRFTGARKTPKTREVIGWRVEPHAWPSLNGKAKEAQDTHQDGPRTSVKAPSARRIHKGLP